MRVFPGVALGHAGTEQVGGICHGVHQGIRVVDDELLRLDAPRRPFDEVLPEGWEWLQREVACPRERNAAAATVEHGQQRIDAIRRRGNGRIGCGAADGSSAAARASKCGFGCARYPPQRGGDRRTEQSGIESPPAKYSAVARAIEQISASRELDFACFPGTNFSTPRLIMVFLSKTYHSGRSSFSVLDAIFVRR